jgi:hypothetical protein
MAKSIITDNYDVCFVDGCYNRPDHEHHLIFGNGRRELSEKYGLKIPICLEHHRWCHELSWKHTVFAESMKILGQLAFERVHGDEDDFKRIFGRSYVDDELREMTKDVDLEHVLAVIWQYLRRCGGG